MPVKNTASAKNARSRRVLVVKHAGGARILRFATLDMRSTAGRVYRARVAELSAHIGGEPNAVERTLLDQGARLHLITALAWDALTEYGAFRHGVPTPACDAYRRAAADERSVLLLLGLDRKVREVPALEDYIKAKSRPRLTFKGKAEEVS